MNLKFYAVTGGGVPLYAYPENGCDESLLTAFASAIYTISEAMFGESITKMNMKGYNLFFKKSENFDLFYAVVSNGKIKEKDLSSRLEDIAKNFESEYKESINTWQGDMHAFKEFDKYFEQKDDAAKLALALFGKKE